MASQPEASRERGALGSDHTLDNEHESPTASEDREDGGEKGDNDNPKPVGFWDKSLNKSRRTVFTRWLLLTLFLCTALLGILSLYWGALFRVEANMDSLIVYVVNFETQSDALVGPLITQATEKMVEENMMPHLGYITIPPSAYNNDPMQVRQAIYDQQAWAAIVINSNATTMLRQAVEQGNSSYDPLGACQIVYVEARDQDTMYDYVLPQISQLQTQVTSMFGEQWVAQVMSNTSISRSNLEKAPQALSPAIGFSMFSLRPFSPVAATPSVTIGLIYLIIISFFSFSFFMPLHMMLAQPNGHPPLKFWQLILWRWISALASYFFLSLAYSLVSLAFQIPFANNPSPSTTVALNTDAYGRASFVVYWMVNWVGMGALGLACENVAMIIGQPWTSMWLIFWVITNVSTSFYAIETAPAFFRWGYAWPLHNIVEASRTIVFDLHSRIGLNFGVLFAWVGVNSAFFPLCCWFMRWKMMREKKKEE